MIGDKTATRPGFSMIEMLVVVAIFAIGSLAIASTYINFTRLHRRVANTETLGTELRFASELLTRQIRNSVPDYPALPDVITSPSSELHLKSRNGASSVWVKKMTSIDAICTGLDADCLALSLDAGQSWAPITGAHVNVDRFSVFVTPAQSPFQSTAVGTYANDTQPVVTFVIDATYKAPELQTAVLSIQTSVAIRSYVR